MTAVVLYLYRFLAFTGEPLRGHLTTIEFRPTLQAQRDDAAEKGQLGRQKVFDGLLARLDQTAS